MKLNGQLTQEYHVIFNISEDMLILMLAFIDLNPFWQGVPFVSHEPTSNQKQQQPSPKSFTKRIELNPCPKGLGCKQN